MTPVFSDRLSAIAPFDEGVTPASVVCRCLRVQRGTLEACIARGHATLEALARATGATTGCGGCTSQVVALTGERACYEARLVEERAILPNVRALRFEPVERNAASSATGFPGQHVMVSTRIDGSWIHRPYTLTSAAGESACREIMVKREPLGHFSRWLFDRREPDAVFRLSRPQGNFRVDLRRPEPIVCLVAGIGMTPALAVARSLAAERTGQRLHIDYSVRKSEEAACRDELEALAAANENITVRFRFTHTGDRLGESDLATYHQQFREARYFVCGPQRYQEPIRRLLQSVDVPPGRIHVETFSPAEPSSPVEEAPRTLDHLGFVIGTMLLATYLAQGFGGLSWPWLEALQSEPSYRLWSGGALLGFLASQWVLPVLRFQAQWNAAALAHRWHRHLGVFAPVLFYAHSTWPGFGYLAALGSVYLANAAVGLCDKTLIRDPERRERFGRRWLVVHVTLSCLTTALALFHVYVVAAYR